MAVLLAILAAACGGTAIAADPASVIVVFDGSGSMWGQIEGSKLSKLVMAREGLRRALAKVGPETRVGLAGFGHRRGDCGDVEVMLPAERLDVERIMAPLGPYNPKGRGPLTAALREAGKSLAGHQGRRSLVLIHDDADNCQADACAAAGELKAAGITVHVVSLGSKPGDAPRMACVPQTTGGRMLVAANGDQVAPAIEEAMRIAGLDAGSPEPRQTVSVQTTQPRTTPLVAEGPPGLYLRALLAPKTEPISWPVHWIVTREGDEGRVLLDARAANPTLLVAPGRYVVAARDGAAVGTMTVEVGDRAPTVVGLPLNAGRLLVRALAQRTGMPLADALISISDAGQGADAKKEHLGGPPLAFFRGGEGMATLPAGRYVVRVEQGLVRAERAVVVPAGSQGRIDIVLNSARVLVSALGRDGAASPEMPVFSIVEDDPDAPKGRREIARSAARQAEFILPPGTYYVIARQGSVEARELLALAPGDTVRRTLTLAAGRLALSSTLAGLAPSARDVVSYRVERIDGVEGEVVTTSRAMPVLQLPGGRYRVEGRYGVMNARSVREVEVRAGQLQQLTLDHQAGILKLRLLSGGVVLGDVFWDVHDEAGRNVWTTGQSEPSVILQAGRYVVRADTRDKRYDRQIEVRGGELRLLELTAD